MTRMRVAGAVLAGGKSSRMGCDKAMLHYEDEPLIARAVGLLGRMMEQVFIVGDRPDLDGFAKVVPDHWPGEGPLCAIATALTDTDQKFVLVLAVDLPEMRAEWLARLLRAASTSEATAVVSVVEGRMQPLCAVYRASLLPALEAVIAGGERRAIEGIRAAAGDGLLEVEASAVEAPWLRNVNSPED
jgi:molybdopterin-guanine dinucleotide biosynthesis protein A